MLADGEKHISVLADGDQPDYTLSAVLYTLSSASAVCTISTMINPSPRSPP